LSRKVLIPAVLSHRQFSVSCCFQKGNQSLKQVNMLKKIMAGREKGKRRFVFNENLPKLEGVKKLSDSKGQGKESNRRVTVLNKLFMKNITDLMSTDKFSANIVGYGLQISTVKVSPDFHSLNVFWLAQGDENDEIIGEILKELSGPIRHELSQLRLMGEIPRIFFLKDKFYSKAAEVDVLLAKADFGEDFVPTDPTLFMKSQLRLQMKLPEDVREKIQEIEENLDEIDEDELPEMRHDVLGIDHSMIMKKIAASIDKKKRAWETFETETDISIGKEPARDLRALQKEMEDFSKEAALRENFMKFLERQQISKRGTTGRKRHEDIILDEDIDDDDYHDRNDDDDYLEDDHDIKK